MGFSGGIWVLRHFMIFSLSVLCSSPNFVHAEVKGKDGRKWYFTTVYRNPNSTMSAGFWEEMDNLNPLVEGPWLMIGDFNSITCRSECSKHGGRLADRVQFANWINQIGFIDLGFSSSPFTWAKGVSNYTRIQRSLDRALCNQK